MALNQGRFITVEGGEGVGKSTLCDYVIELLGHHNVETILTREPGGSDGADQIRQMLVTGPEDRWDSLAETLLLFAARRDHVVRTILPALNAGIWVISDRFVDSTFAYQGHGHGLDLNFLETLTQKVTENLTPDITIILDAPSEVGINRALQRGGVENRYEMLHLDFHERARQGFLKIAEANPRRCRVVNATRSPDTIRAEIDTIIADKFGFAASQTLDLSTPQVRFHAS